MEASEVAMVLSGPAGMAIMGYWVKSSLTRLESIPTLLLELEHLKHRQAEIRVKLDEFSKLREELIILRSEVKTQWQRIDDIKNKQR